MTPEDPRPWPGLPGENGGAALVAGTWSVVGGARRPAGCVATVRIGATAGQHHPHNDHIFAALPG